MSEKLSSIVNPGEATCGLDITSDKIARAYNIGYKLFDGINRKSGEPYFTHCVEVARIIQKEWGITNEDVIIAAILHDAVEDTPFTLVEIREQFGDTVADLVDGVTALTSSDHETVKKVLGEKTINLGVAAIKLADRVHNMRTLGSMPAEKRVKKATETMEVYTRLAESIGFWNAKTELEDLSFQYMDPENFTAFKAIVDQDPRRQAMFVDHVKSRLENSLIGTKGDQQVIIKFGGYWAIYDKWQKRAQRGECSPDNLNQIEDVTQFYIVTKDLDSAYLSTGRIRENFSSQIDSSRSQEYVGKAARTNGYQAIETAIQTDLGDFSVAVVTSRMHQYNQFGAVNLLNNNEYQNREHDLIYVFTSAGRIRFLPQGSTGFDVAAQISPDVLVSATGVSINGVVTNLSSVISNGADVEVLTNPTQLSVLENAEMYCTLPTTREMIARQRNQETREVKVREGKLLLEPFLSWLGILDLDDVGLVIKPTLDKLGCSQPSDLYFKIKSGSIRPESAFSEIESAINKAELKLSSIRLRGTDHPHILQKLMSVIDKTNRNIYNIRLAKAGNDFELRVVIQDLDAEQKKTLESAVRRRFSKDNFDIGFAL